jgi:molybdenum storage protein
MTERTTDRVKDEERLHIESRFARESLVDKQVLADARVDHDVVRMLPQLNVLKIGGQSIMDRGRVAVFPIMEEIASLMSDYQLLLGAGGGTRSRHVYQVALELGLPTGILAILGGAPSEQNALMMQVLLAKYGAIRVPKDHFDEIPLYLATKCVPIVTGMPPYHYWEHPPENGDLPAHRTDTGVYMLAEVFGARSMIFVKDEDGLFTDDPKKNPKAELIPKISISELRERDLDDLILERACIDMISRARRAKVVQVVNGLVPGRITAALKGEHVGTIVYQDGADPKKILNE